MPCHHVASTVAPSTAWPDSSTTVPGTSTPRGSSMGGRLSTSVPRGGMPLGNVFQDIGFEERSRHSQRPAIGLEVLTCDEALVVTPGIGHREMVAAEHPVQVHQDTGDWPA